MFASFLCRYLLQKTKKIIIRWRMNRMQNLLVRTGYKEWIKLLGQMMPENIFIRLIDPKVPCVVNADTTRMQQILWNLALNARDALPNGGEI